MAKKIKLIVGLGNPGQRYYKTRHNAGFMVIDQIVVTHNLGNPQKNKNYELWIWDLAESKILFVKPLTFMNNSGEAVAEIVRFFKIADDDILILSDDLDLAVGQVRFRDGGGSGGHKGLQSIIDCLGFDHFGRVKIGIGRPPEKVSAEDYVLSEFSTQTDVISTRELSDTVERSNKDFSASSRVVRRRVSLEMTEGAGRTDRIESIIDQVAEIVVSLAFGERQFADETIEIK